MTHTPSSKEIVLMALDHRQPPRVPCSYVGTPEIDQRLKKHFSADSMDEVFDRLGVDIRFIGLEYIGPSLRTWPDGRFENCWGQIRKPVTNEAGTYMEAVEYPYAAFQTVEDVDNFRWPKPEWFDYSPIKAKCEAYKDYAIVFGGTQFMDLINQISLGRGNEQFMYDLALEDPVGLRCMDKRFELCYEMAERGLKAAGGKADIFWMGDDYGTQKGMLISPAMWRKLFYPKLKAMCDLGHKYGAKVMLHACGSTAQVWPDIIEAGVDIYDTVQPEARGMDAAVLKEEYGDQICFHGTISTQKTLPFGTPDEVAEEVRQRIDIVGQDGGFIVAPAHNFQPDTPLENIFAMYNAVKSHPVPAGSPAGCR